VVWYYLILHSVSKVWRQRFLNPIYLKGFIPGYIKTYCETKATLWALVWNSTTWSDPHPIMANQKCMHPSISFCFAKNQWKFFPEQTKSVSLGMLNVHQWKRFGMSILLYTFCFEIKTRTDRIKIKKKKSSR